MRSISERSFLLLLPLLLLSGCIEVEQEVWVDPDGTGKLRFDISAPSPEDPSAQASSVPAEEVIALARELRNDPRLRSTPRVGRYVLDGYDHVELELLTRRWSDLPGLNRQVLDMAGSGDRARSAVARVFRFSLDEDDEGNIQYRQTLSRQDVQTSRESLAADGSWEEASRVRGGLRILVHSPTISRSNGRWQLNKTSVLWTLNLRELMVGRNLIRPFEVEIGPSARSPQFWRVIGIILVVSMLVGILTSFRHARRRAKRPGSDIR